MKKTILVILDGLGDRPIKDFGGKTPLEAAKTPNLDKLATDGICGVMNAMPKKLYPTSEEAHLAIFGYDFVGEHPGRGVLEALGIGVKLKPDELAFRANFGTVDEKLRLTDARAGVIDSVKDLCKAVDNIEIDNVRFRIYPSLQHRAVLVLSGQSVANFIQNSGCISHTPGEKNHTHQVSSKCILISDTDPHKAGPHKLGVRVLHPKASGGSREGKTVARALERYQLLAHEILNEHKVNKKRVKKGKLPANFVLTRGCGYLKNVTGFKDKYGVSSPVCIAGAPLYKGIAKYLGMKVVKVRGATGKLDTNIKAKVKAVEKVLKKNDFVFLHIKGTDMAAEDYGDPKLKKEFIEKIDRDFSSLLKLKNVTIAVTGDHATPCELKDHSSDVVPLLIKFEAPASQPVSPRRYRGGQGGLNPKSETNLNIKNSKQGKIKFGESFCERGSLGHIYGKELMSKLLEMREM